MRLPLRHTVPALILVVGMTALMAVYAIERETLSRNLRSLADQQLRSISTFVAAELEAAFRSHDTASARATIERASSDSRIKLVLHVTPAGEIMFASDPAMRGQHIADVAEVGPVVEALRKQDDTLEAGIVQLPEVGKVAGSFPVQMRGVEQDFLPDEFGRLIMLYDMSVYVQQQRYQLMMRMLPRGIVLALVTLGFWLLFRRVLLRRINLLVNSVRAVAKGDFSSEPRVSGRDELSELGEEIAGMMRNLRNHSEKIAFLADHDALTGLLNRHGFEEEVERALRYLRPGGNRYVVCLMDIDSLRVVNDTRGHMVGDELLKAFGDMLSERIPHTLGVARVGGDEFTVLVEPGRGGDLDALAEQIHAEVHDFRFVWGTDRFGVQVSIGLVELKDSMANATEALSLADSACYAAKEGGHRRYAIWQPGTEEWSVQHGQMRWVSRIQQALDEGRFQLHAQTIKPLEDDGSKGEHLEILVRMLDEEGSIVPPGEFLGAAERYNLIGRIDRWVIRETLDWLQRNEGFRNNLEMCSINLSGLSFGDTGLLEEIRSTLGESRAVRPGQLCFEVTETAAITHLKQAQEFIENLRGMGCRFALDDFGTGVSSFGYLKNLPVDYIKIDGIFVRDIARDPADRAIVSSINNIAHQMGKQTIAEFVETQEIIRVLKEIGVDYAQGYGISRPEPLDNFRFSRTGGRRNSA